MTSNKTWKKIGLIFNSTRQYPWMQSHAAVPIAELIEKDTYRVYFSSRDNLNQSHTCYVIIDLNNPKTILEISREPVLSPGELGEFDDSGAMATWLTRVGSERRLYYIGWNLGVTVPFRNSIGLSIDRNGEGFKRVFSGPIMDRTKTEPHFCASCCVLPDGELWKMWYLSCVWWSRTSGKPRHHYHIKYAESLDGINWTRDGVVSIDFNSSDEYAISRPSVIKDSGFWRMWYSIRGLRYRIGYAESEDGKKWLRKDSMSGIDVSLSGWDSEMVEYPFVFEHKGQRYMLYNGNGYGITGFGLAIWE